MNADLTIIGEALKESEEKEVPLTELEGKWGKESDE